MSVISIANAKEVEGKPGSTGTLRFVVSLSAPAAQEVSFDYATADSAKAKALATAETDYTAQSGTLTFAVGQTELYIDIPVLGDSEKEAADEAFDLVLSNAVGASIGKDATLTAVGTITDDEPTISVGTAKVDEGAASTGGLLRFLVSLSAAAPQEITLAYDTAGSGKAPATADTDFTATSGTLTLAVGETQAYVEVPVLPDIEVEDDETLDLTLSTPVGAGFSKGDTLAATGTIVDDEGGKGGSGTLSISSTSDYEGEILYFTVSLSAPSSNAVTVNYAAATIKSKAKTGIAKNGTDFDKATGQISFDPGETAQVIAIQTTADTLWEGTETFELVLSKPKGAALSGGVTSLKATATLLDDEPTLSASAATLYEPTTPADGTAVADNLKLMRFAVSLSAPTANEVSVAYSFTPSKDSGKGTADTLAKSGKDFVQSGGVLEFQPGDVTAYAYVEILDDASAESSETFSLVLSKPVGAAFADNTKTLTVVGTIIDNEPSISLG